MPDSHPTLTCAAAKAHEAALLRDEAAEWDAMQRAGRAIAGALLDDAREIGGLSETARLLVLVGKGHNGGDAMLAAQALLAARPQARADVLLCFGGAALRPLARRALDGLRKAGAARVREVALATLKSELAGYEVCLDGVFGFQFRPPMDDATAEILAWVNTHPRIRLRAAVDLPSGVAEGDERGQTAFRADFTYATGIVKCPAIEPMNRDVVGRLRYLDLGFFSAAICGPGALTRQEGESAGRRVEAPRPQSGPRVLLTSILAPLARLRTAQSDKRTFGHLFVVGGSRSYPGAVLMTVQAALRSGVGLLTAFVPASLAPEYAAKFPEAMWVAWPETAAGGLALSGLKLLLEKLPRATALVAGPGLGAESETLSAMQEIVRAAGVPLLLDADALRPEILRAAQGKRFICTPHAGEFQRIMGEPGWREVGAVVVLKGQPTQVSDRKNVYFNLLGGPVLARGGSGDVLAGLIGGLLAQAPDDLMLAACRGTVWHGLAADLLARDRGQVAVQTTQLFDYLQPALLHASHETP